MPICGLAHGGSGVQGPSIVWSLQHTSALWVSALLKRNLWQLGSWIAVCNVVLLQHLLEPMVPVHALECHMAPPPGAVPISHAGCAYNQAACD